MHTGPSQDRECICVGEIDLKMVTTSNHVQHVIKIYQTLSLLTRKLK